jgi:hypothetical protein
MRANDPGIPEAGHFEYETFHPETWKNNYPNPAFDLRTPGDTYWAARLIMDFDDDEIRAIVDTGQFTDRRAAEWIARCLIERRNKIGRAFFEDVLPIDHFTVSGDRLAFEDLSVKRGFHAPRQYSIQWSEFDNLANRKGPIGGATRLDVPRSASPFLAADIRAEDPHKTVTVYLRNHKVVGVDRTW